MKWFLLVLFVACGHEQPPAKDVADSDGDHVLNYEEESDQLKKYTAEVRPFGEVKASLTFRKDLASVQVELSNESNLSETCFRLLTKRAELLKVEEHFSEWSKLRIAGPVPEGAFSGKAYEFTLRFQEKIDRPDYLEYNGVNLGEFQPVMKFHLTGPEITDILSGKAHLTLRRKKEGPLSEDTTIRKRTYRVFWHDGHRTQVYYVSKELPFMRFVALKQIEQVRDADELDGLGWNSLHRDWWFRDVNGSDRVLVKATEKDLAEARALNFTKTSSLIQRVNGQPAKSLELAKAPGTKVVLKIRAEREKRSFSEHTHKFYRGGGHEEGRISCYNFERKISSAVNVPLTSQDVLSELVVAGDSKAIPSAELVTMARESADENGPYLELHLENEAQQMKVTLPSRPGDTFTKTGVYKWYCESPRAMEYGGTVTNDEGHFTLKIESFVEKLEE